MKNLVQLTVERPFPDAPDEWPPRDPSVRLRASGFRFGEDGQLTGQHEMTTDERTGTVMYRQWEDE